VGPRQVDDHSLAPLVQLPADFGDQVAARGEACFQAVDEFVPAGQVSRALSEREDQPVGSRFIELLHEIVEIETVDDPVQVGRLFLGCGAFGCDEVMGHYAIATLRHPGRTVGSAVGFDRLDRRPGERRIGDEQQQETCREPASRTFHDNPPFLDRLSGQTRDDQGLVFPTLEE
jgi:hypothetical protein